MSAPARRPHENPNVRNQSAPSVIRSHNAPKIIGRANECTSPPKKRRVQLGEDVRQATGVQEDHRSIVDRLVLCEQGAEGLRRIHRVQQDSFTFQQRVQRVLSSITVVR